MIKFSVRNHGAIADKISQIPRGARAAATQSAAFALLGNKGNTAKGLQYYPPPPPQSKYRRTYNLRFGWQVSDWGDRTKITISNDMAYAPYVQGTGTQAWMHVKRWRTVKKIISDNMSVIKNAIDKAVADYLKSKGF